MSVGPITLEPPPAGEPRRASDARRLVPLLPALLTLALVSVLWWRFTVDDAFITWRYAEHLVHGQGAVFNPGERIEGYSSPAFMAACALAGWLGLDIPAAGKALDVACAFGIVLVSYAGLMRLGVRPWLAGMGCLWMVLMPTWQAYVATGMETMPFALAVTSLAMRPGARAGPLVRGLVAFAILFAVATLRPEGPLVALAGGLAWWSSDPDHATRDGLLAAASVCVVLLVMRHAYYGSWSANTFLVKPPPIVQWWAGDDVAHALAAEVRALRRNVVPLYAELGGMVAAIGAFAGVGVLVRDRRAWGALAVAAAGTVTLIAMPADWMPGERFALPFVPVTIALVVVGLDRIADRLALETRRLAGAAALIGVLVTLPITLEPATSLLIGGYRGTSNPPCRAEDAYTRIGRWLARHARPGERLLAYEVGAVAYWSDVTVIDHEGLVTGPVAREVYHAGEYGPVRTGADAVAMGRVVDYCVGRRPEWFLVRSNTTMPLSLGAPVPPEAAEQPIQRAMLERFGDAMVLAASFPLSGPDEPGADRYLLLHRTAR